MTVMDKKEKYYFVGSIIDGEEQIEHFIDEKKWELGWFDNENFLQYQKMLAIYNQIVPGDYIVIKSSYVRKNDLPFSNPTNTPVSVMKLKALGKVIKNENDGHTLLVDWDKNFNPKEWYFFTGRQAIWDVTASKKEAAMKLVKFVSENEPQDYDWFLSQPEWTKYKQINEKSIPNTLMIGKDNFEQILDFFVTVGQEKILTKVDDSKTKATNYYNIKHRVNTSNNTLGLNRTQWKENISKYKDYGIQEEWFEEGIECIHFANGNPQTKNYAWRNASIHFSFDHKYAIEIMFDVGKATGDNLIKGLNARLFNLYDEDRKHSTNNNSYTSIKGDDILLKIPVAIGQESDGRISNVKVEISDKDFLHFNKILENITKYFTNEDGEMSTKKSIFTPYSDDVVESKNVIFRGAPGTGKSYLAKQIAADIVSNGNAKNFNSLSDEEKKQIEFVQFHPSYDYSDFVEGLRPKTNDDGTMGFELQDGIFTKFIKRAQRNFDNSKKTQETIEKEATINELMTDYFSNIELGVDELKSVRGTKFYITSIDEKFINISIPENKISNKLSLNINEIQEMLKSEREFKQVKDVTMFFNKINATQNYSYDLAIFNEIRGLKKKTTQTTVKHEEEQNYVFIIDEINRGEISKIFGELFFSIDPEYRGPSGEVSTQYSNLHENPEIKFSVPENVFIIGTMNDIDHSVDSFDFAMRRRFRFIEIKADERLEMLDSLDEEIKIEAIKRMTALNNEISKVEELNENFHIGASYFLKLKRLNFEQLWTDYLHPLLQEYIRGMYDEDETIKKFAKAYGFKPNEVGEINADIENQGQF